MPLFLDAFLLALASSTDNFMVGLSVGISKQSLPFAANALISVCNASGAWLASFGGGALGKSLPPHLPPLLSAIAFGVLALKEFWDFWQTVQRKKNLLLLKKKEGQSIGEQSVEESTTSSGNENSLNMSRAIHLAIPMTLNNLAGGVAGGAIGISPLQAGLYGLLASFLTMAAGHWIGQYFARISNTKGKDGGRTVLDDPSFASGSLLGLLSLMSLHESSTT